MARRRLRRSASVAEDVAEKRPERRMLEELKLILGRRQAACRYVKLLAPCKRAG